MFPGPGRVHGLPIGGQPAPQLGQPFLPQQGTARFKGTEKLDFYFWPLLKLLFAAKKPF
jgi:hypothetical protein